MSEPSLQETYAPESICYGCGPANAQGFRIRSVPDGSDPDVVVCEWQPSPHHHAFPGMLNGGVIGTLLDCHMNWTASWHLMRKGALPSPPCTVTAEYAVTLKRPTPMAHPVVLRARVVASESDRATVEATLEAAGADGARKVCATGRGTFVAVKPGHPAYHRW